MKYFICYSCDLRTGTVFRSSWIVRFGSACSLFGEACTRYLEPLSERPFEVDLSLLRAKWWARRDLLTFTLAGWLNAWNWLTAFRVFQVAALSPPNVCDPIFIASFRDAAPCAYPFSQEQPTPALSSGFMLSRAVAPLYHSKFLFLWP